jgi:hypothetical protein
VLGLVTGPEAARFAQHLERCPVCHDEVIGLERTAGAMGQAPRRVPPAPDLRERVSEPARTEAELFRAAGPDAPVAHPRPR